MKKQTLIALGLMLVVILIIAIACQAPPTQTAQTAQTGPVQVEIVNWDEAAPLTGNFAPAEESRAAGNVTALRSLKVLLDGGIGRDLTVGNDAAVGGDMTITGGLSVTGGVTGTNVLTTGNQTIAGIKTFSTPAVIPGLTGPLSLTGPTAVATATPAMIINNLGAANNAFEVRDAATPVFVIGQAGAVTLSGALTANGGVTGPVVLTGPTAAATATPAMIVNNTGAGNVSFEVRDAATPVFQVLNGGSVAAGAINSSRPILAKDASYLVTAADTGAIIKASGAVTLTLPGAAAGLSYCVVNFTGDDQVIDFTDSADVALNEVNSPGDRVTNTTAYDNICLTAIDAVNWVTISSLGTWADGN